GYNVTWGTWSAHALILGYLEQQPLYNAANFSWAVVMNQGWSINSTVSNAIISTFLCPSDGMSPSPVPAGDQWSGRINNYFASLGTTVGYEGSAKNPVLDTTGVFTFGGGQGLRRPERHGRDLQYDRVRRGGGRPLRPIPYHGADPALAEWHQCPATIGR